MNFLLLLLCFSVSSLFCFAQGQIASECTYGSAKVSVRSVKKTDMGVPNSTIVSATNNLPGQVVVALYILRTDGDLRNEGYSKPLNPGETFDFHYNQDNVSKYFVYYKNYPSNEKFPSSSELKKTLNYGYGN